MQKLWLIKYIITIFLMTYTTVYSQIDLPTGDKFWFKDKQTLMHLNCRPTKDNSGDIDCEIIKTSIFPNATKESLEKDLAKNPFREEFDESGKIRNQKLFAQACDKELIGMAKFLLGYDVDYQDLGMTKEAFKKGKEKQDMKFKTLSSEEREYQLDYSKIMLNFCDKKDYQSYLDILIHQHKIYQKTCSIFNSYENHTFKKLNEKLFIRETRDDFSDCPSISINSIRKTGELSWEWEFEYKNISLNPHGKTDYGRSCGEADILEVYKPTMVTGRVNTGCTYFK